MKLFKIYVTVILVLMLSGCWSSRELDELAVVMGIGIDKKDDDIECCTQVIVPQNVGTAKEGGGNGNEPYTNFVTDDKELSACIGKVSNITGKSIFMSHTLVAVFGDETAREGIYKYLDYLMRDNQLRLRVCLFVTDKSAKEILGAETPLFEIPSINLSEISEELSNTFTGQSVTVLDFINNMMCKQKGSMLPVISLDDSKIKVSGAAVFNGDKMVDSISGEDLRGVLWVLGDARGGDLVFDINNNSISLRISKIKSKTVTVIDENGDISFKVHIKSDLHLVRDDANVIETAGMDAALKTINASVENQVLSSLSKMQDIGIDVYGFGDLIYRKHPSVWRTVESTWGERYKKLRVDVCADCNIIETGSIIGSVRNLESNSE